MTLKLDLPSEVFEPTEKEIISKLSEVIPDELPVSLSGGLLTVIMKATRLCNLRCKYCHAWRDGPNQRMDVATMLSITKQAIAPENVKTVSFVWHGGEITLMPIQFFRKAITAQRLFKRNDQVIENSIQTNAVHLTEDWLDFIEENNISVGVSLDGGKADNDLNRVDKKGLGTWERALKGLQKLKARKVKTGVLMVLSPSLMTRTPRELLVQLTDIGITKVSILNVIADNSDDYADKIHVPFSEYVSYLVDLYKLWSTPEFRSKISIRELESIENNVRSQRPQMCIHSKNCMGQFLTIEPNGSVGPCDKYVGDSNFEFGNLREQPLHDILLGSKELIELQNEENRLMTGFANCKHSDICKGGCAHDARMNEWFSGVKSGCCGLSPLIDVIQGSLQEKENQYVKRN